MQEGPKSHGSHELAALPCHIACSQGPLLIAALCQQRLKALGILHCTRRHRREIARGGRVSPGTRGNFKEFLLQTGCASLRLRVRQHDVSARIPTIYRYMYYQQVYISTYIYTENTCTRKC